MFRTSPCYGCCSKGSGFTRTFLYAKLYSVCHFSWWNLSLPPSLACRVTVAASLPPIFLSKYQSNTFLIFQQHLFPLSAIRSHRVSRGYLSLFQWSFFLFHTWKKKGKNTYLYLSSALVQFPFSVWCCCSKPPAETLPAPCAPFASASDGSGASFPLDYFYTSPFLHHHTFIYLFLHNSKA